MLLRNSWRQTLQYRLTNRLILWYKYKAAKAKGLLFGEMAERLNAHDSKSCYGRNRTGVQIPISPPKGNNTNTETNSGFVLFFSNDYFGIRIELWILTTIAGRKQSLGFFYAEKDWKNCKNMLYSIKKNMLIVSKTLATLKLIVDYNSYRGGKHWKRTRK